jgi:AbrB family looped-hinge helix DNA binding protein
VRVLFDTNVVLDVLLEREPHAHAAAQLMSLADDGVLDGYLCATTITAVHHLTAKALGPKRAASLVATLLDLFQIAPVDREVVTGALDLGFVDFEDAVIHEAAVLAEASAIVTRNGRDFKGARMPVFDPAEMLAAVYASEALALAGEAAETYAVALEELAPKFQVVIPKAIRESLGLRPGQKVQAVQYGDRIELVPMVPVAEMQGFLRGVDNDFAREEDRM